ncbi:hypothetical protein N7540_007126 [Penicillium herquei]|nr:hypothetical protein N7540_007126 [Penicillium herquei]
MSTQSPHPPTPKGPRNNNNYNHNNNNNRRPTKKNGTPLTQKTVLLNTPPSSPPRHMSPGGVATDSSIVNNVHSKKKPPRSGKKPKDNMNRASPAPNGQNQNGHRHTSSHSTLTPQQQQPKDSAYAGPTFHASPAPSALPIPSFFSKSLPESDLAPTLETDSDTADMDGDLEVTPSKPRARPPQPEANEPKSTPLDFLFKAAVQARQSNPMTSPETTSRMRSPQTDSKYLHSNSSGGMFAFEMDPSEQARASPIGPSFAPSYQDRMKALRSSSTQSLDADAQRRLKTQELKHMLLNPRPQKPSVSAAQEPQYTANPLNPANYVNGHHSNGNVPHYATPTRTNSGPPAPVSWAQGHSPVPLQQMPNNAGRTSYPYANGHSHVRNSESPLRREVPAHYNVPSPGPYGNPNPYMRGGPVQTAVPPTHYVSPQPQYATASFKMPTSSPSPSKSVDTKKMEDDLRRILKLDAAPGIQSSFA